MTLHLAAAPRFAEQHAYTCFRCEHEELLHPVFLSDGNAYGSRCAAIALGLVDDTATAVEASKALKVAQVAHTALELAARTAKAHAASSPWFAFCDTYGGVPATIAHFGGYPAARAAFKELAA